MTLTLNASQLDALREVGNIGAGNAAKGLSELLKRRIQVHLPTAKLLDFEGVPDFLGGAEKGVAAVFFEITGMATGSILLLFPLKEALRLANLLLGRKHVYSTTKILDEMAASALKELGNICSGCYLSALCEMTRIKIVHSVPGLATDMLGAVLDEALSQLALRVDKVLILETEFGVEGERVCGHFLFLPNPEGLQALLEALKVQ